MTRRQAVKNGVVTAMMSVAGRGLAQTVAAGPAVSDPASRMLVTIEVSGRINGLLAGCAVADGPLRFDTAYRELVRRQAGIVVSENAFKFGPLRPTPTTYFFDRADELANFARDNGIALRGHNFVWHHQLPAWFDSYVTKQNAERVLVEHIERVGGRYAGQMHSWDVVNEAIQVDDKLRGGLRMSPWQRLLPGYIDIAFRTARRVDPKALLIYNDYGLEGDDGDSAAKRNAVLELLQGMLARGVPVDGLGVQSHIEAVDGQGNVPSYGVGLMAMIAAVRGMGLKVLITEMDVNDRKVPEPIVARDSVVAAAYGQYLDMVLADPAVIAVLTWGITDKYTWLNSQAARDDKLPERCLPFDAEMQPKPAFREEIRALQQSPIRG